MTMPTDERQILNLLHRYCELQDSGNFALVSELFSHCRYVVDGGESCFGYDEVFELKTRHDRTYDAGALLTKHVTTNTNLELDDGAPRATARSYFQVLQATPQLPLQVVIA